MAIRGAARKPKRSRDRSRFIIVEFEFFEHFFSGSQPDVPDELQAVAALVRGSGGLVGALGGGRRNGGADTLCALRTGHSICSPHDVTVNLATRYVRHYI